MGERLIALQENLAAFDRTNAGPGHRHLAAAENQVAFVISRPAWVAVCSMAPATSDRSGLIGSTIWNEALPSATSTRTRSLAKFCIFLLERRVFLWWLLPIMRSFLTSNSSVCDNHSVTRTA
jgi:hypothetical protein